MSRTPSPRRRLPDVAPLLKGSGLIDLRWGAPAWGDAGVIVPWTIYVRTKTRVSSSGTTTPWPAGWSICTKPTPTSFARTGWETTTATGSHRRGSYPQTSPRHGLLGLRREAHGRDGRGHGRHEDAKKYRDLNENIKAAFNEAYVSPDGRIEGDTQTCYLLALHMELLPEDLRSAAAEHLVRTIEREDWHLSTGFVGVGYLCPGPD